MKKAFGSVEGVLLENAGRLLKICNRLSGKTVWCIFDKIVDATLEIGVRVIVSGALCYDKAGKLARIDACEISKVVPIQPAPEAKDLRTYPPIAEGCLRQYLQQDHWKA